MNCANSFCFHVYLILYACAARFDVMGNLENFCELNKAEIKLLRLLWLWLILCLSLKTLLFRAILN